MASTLQHFPQQSLILVAFLHLTAALTVQLKYTRPTVKRDSMPDGLDVTLTGETGTSSDVKLRLLQHSVPDVPVYTLGVDESGQYFKRLEELEVNPNVAYYHDLNNDAVMQVIRTAGRGDREAHYELQGHLNIEGQRYSLNPDDKGFNERSRPRPRLNRTLWSDKNHHGSPETTTSVPTWSLSASQDDLQFVEDAQTMIPDLGNLFKRDNGQRREACGVQPVFIDVAAVVDYARYSEFLASSGSKNEALQAIRLRYAFIFSGMDLMYKGIKNQPYFISVPLVKLVIAETPAASQPTELYQVLSSPRNLINVDKALDALMLFSERSENQLKPNDHVMFFTGMDLTTVAENGTIDKGVGGVAFLSTLCNERGSSISIIEDHGDLPLVVSSAAHELGHSFSAAHDGEGNTCNETDRFIMFSGKYPATPANKYNAWQFSSCSINYFMSYITEILGTNDGAKCLLGQIDASGVTNVSSRLPGQEYSVDQQCRMIEGSSSYMCRQDAVDDICTSMPCLFPSDGRCYSRPAAMGTTCANGKMCISGRCVSDPRAPAVDDNCVFGDTTGNLFDNKTCSQLANEFSGYCYDSEFMKQCCGSCKAVYKNVTGCEYGNKRFECVSRKCRFYPASDRSKCCHTCPSTGSSIPTGFRSPVNREKPIFSPEIPLVQPAVKPPAQEGRSILQD